jgi:hypothetical protein
VPARKRPAVTTNATGNMTRNVGNLIGPPKREFETLA